MTSDKDGATSVFEKELPDAEIVISQPFWPAYMTKERFDKAKKLKLVVTAGIGSEHTICRAGRGQGRHRGRGHLLQLDQRLRAHRDDDLGARAQLHPVLRVGDQRRLEHRRLRRALLRSRRHECRHRRRRPHRACRAQASEAIRCQASLLRQASPAEGGGEGARPHLPSQCSSSGQSVRRRHHQYAAAARPSTCSTTS